MKKMLEKVKDSKGFVSLEVIAIAVIIIALAAFVLYKFKGTAESSSESVDTQINKSIEGINDNAADSDPNDE